MNNEKMKLELQELELLTEKHKMLVKETHIKNFGIIMMSLTLLCGFGLFILSLITEQLALCGAAFTIIILSTMQMCSISNEKVDIIKKMRALEDEIDDKIASQMADVIKDLHEITNKIANDIEQHKLKIAQQDAQKCSKNGKNTKNNAKKAENKTKTTKKGDK